MNNKVSYKVNQPVELEKIINLLHKSDYLPIEDMSNTNRLKKMFTNANLIVSAWDENKRIGIARSLCDYCYCCYLSDICVDKDYRKLKVGKALMRKTKEEAGNMCKLILHSSETAIGFYENIGMKKTDNVFIIQREF